MTTPVVPEPVVPEPVVPEPGSELRIREAVRALVIDPDDRVLLVRFEFPNTGTHWATPGGGVEPGETDHQALRRELDEISQKLSDRKLVDKAKGVLMKARGLDEDAAYHAMRKLAMERGQSMAKVARDVIDMARVLL